jgi:hypothetical protein
MEVAMTANQAGKQPRWLPWALVLAGIAMIAFVFGGFPALRAIGVPVDAPQLGAVVLQLLVGGFLCVIVGLALPLQAKPLWMIGIGAVLLCAGTGPLIVVGVMAELGLSADPNPNPVGFGMLALFTSFPALVLLVWGFVNWRSAKRSTP